MRHWIALWLACALCLLPWTALTEGQAEAVETEERKMTLQEMNITPLKSLKKPGEGNPLFTQRFGADPGAMVYDGRVYVYLTDDAIEYDAAGEVKENSYSQIRSITCLSSADLVNWTDHGQIPVAGPRGIARWATNSWAPCAAHKVIDGKEKFFLYFCNGGNGIGVLAADSPTGPWRDELGHLLITRSTPNCAGVVWLFDPAVMVDEDGTGYLAFGGGVPKGKDEAPGTGRIVRLGDDMLSLDGVPVTLDVPWLFEDSGLNRVGDRYVYSYCSNWNTAGNPLLLTSGAIQYMTAEDPLGPYTYGGELFPNQGRFFGLYGNNHHSLVEFEGQWYLFYHSRPVEKAMGITGNYRSPQVDRIELGGGSRVFRSVRGTMKGVPQLRPLDARQRTEAGCMADQAGIRVTGCGPDARVETVPGSWIRVAGADFGEGTAALTVEAAGTGRVYVLADSLTGPVAAWGDLPEAGTLTLPLSLSGVHDLYFLFDGGAVFTAWQAR